MRSMESILFIVRREVDIDVFRKMWTPFYVIQELPEWNQITIVDASTDRHAFFRRGDFGDYEPEEMEVILKEIEDPVCFDLACSDHAFLCEVLRHIEVDGLIDDCFWTLWNSSEFLNNVKLDPSWDWRQTARKIWQKK